LERAQELKHRVKTLVTLLVDDLKEKKAEEIQEKLKKDVETLEQFGNPISYIVLPKLTTCF